MRLDKTEGGREKGALWCEALCYDEKNLYNCVTHPSIECVEEATKEGPDCNSQR